MKMNWSFGLGDVGGDKVFLEMSAFCRSQRAVADVLESITTAASSYVLASLGRGDRRSLESK